MLKTSTITFLRQLKKNNDKSWFDEHKAQYLAAKADFEALISALLTAYGKTDPDIGHLRVKDCVFRIYRDVRFSKDKTPYKTHFAAGMNKGGKRVHFPGYYLHIGPGAQSFAGGGIWRPEKEMLQKIRQEIDYNWETFHKIISAPAFKRSFGQLSEEDSLVRPPKGYEADNPAIAFLKLRSFIAGTGFTDKELTQPGFVKKLVARFKQLKPLIDFLETALDG